MSEHRQLPPACRPGDRVAIIAPASPFNETLLHEGCALLRSWGLEPVYGTELLSQWGYLAGDDELRVQSMHRAFTDPSIRAVICARGGYGTARLVPSLLPLLPQWTPKRFVGFSDITTLHQVFLQHSDWITFHGPMVASALLSQGPVSSQERLRQALFGQELSSTCAPVSGQTLQAGVAEGTVIGGNLSILLSTLGTPQQLDTEGAILVIEDVNEPPYRIDRMWQQLRQAELLSGLAGLVIGDFGTLKDQYTTYETAGFWRDRISLPTDCPVMFDVPFGHIAENITLPIGASATLEVGPYEGILHFD